MTDLARLLREGFDQPTIGLSGKPSTLDDIFEEEPVDLTTFVTDKRFMGNPPLSPVQYDAVRHIERVYYPDLYPAMAAEFDPKKSRTTIGPAGKHSKEVVDSYWADSIRMVNFVTLQWG